MEIQHQWDSKAPSNACWKVSVAGTTARAFAIFSTNICSISHLLQKMVDACINMYLRLKRANFEVSPTVGVYREGSVSGEKLPVHQLSVANLPLNSAQQELNFHSSCSWNTALVQCTPAPSSTLPFVYGIIIRFIIITLACKYCTYPRAAWEILHLQAPFCSSVIKLYTEHRVAPGKHQNV